ncbi:MULTISPECIES: RAD55 family ATPase [unclassified Schlesneria]|uniref:RAD55 family ATPase n=1 Tax=Schlesneria TaxID=656899 RepID=UPI002F2101F9
MATSERFSTGIAELDSLLGGGLIPGTLTVVMGATGIGKTQLGLQFANAGLKQEGERGILFDMTSRGDAQNHADYAKRICDWVLKTRPLDVSYAPEEIWNRDAIRTDYFHVFDRTGRRVTLQDLDQEQWQEWRAELNKKLDQAIAYFYGNFAHGVRRSVIDGVEPVDRASDSFQFQLFDYIYHQILHKDHDWVARDLFRVNFRANEQTVAEHAYDHNKLATMLLYTSHEVKLDDLIDRPIESGDVLCNANTIILMGKVRDGNRMRRALHVAKHRGSAADDGIVPFEIGDSGLMIGQS